MSKTSIRKCRYSKCKHPSRDIDISVEKFIKDGSCFYHENCHETMKKERKRDTQRSADIKLILDLWSKHISRTVNYGFLTKILNEYIDRGVSSGYLVFAMQYVISHHMKLNYPLGFKYYVDMPEIRNAYNKTVASQIKKIDFDIKAKNDSEPKFKVKKKDCSFQSILH